jgi:L-histidine Nalpha-methyltransferase
MRSALPESRADYESTVEALTARPRQLPTEWLYDERGSQLYEAITRLPEYYLPRREAEILRERAPTIAQRTRARTLIELGAGGAKNTRYLLDELKNLEVFVPFDLSESMLTGSVRGIAAAYPALSVQALVGDFQRDLDVLPPGGRRLIALLGSTIGNLMPERRTGFLRALAASLGEGDAFVAGLDLVKEARRLEAAYNDEAGVTEAFVRNALTAVNAELDATFEQERFSYQARWDQIREWMDIGLRARSAHKVGVRGLGLEIDLHAGELLRVEISAKFRREAFARELAFAGLSLEAWWTDAAGDYAIAFASRI